MADSGQEKEFGSTNPVGAAATTNHDELLDVDGKEEDYINITTHGEPSSNASSETGDEKDSEKENENEKRPNIDRTKSYATTTSVVTRTDSHVDEQVEKKPWYKQVNPLRWGSTPPVPETRKVSREYHASFLSLVYFQWMAPIMSVSLMPANPKYIH
jgi:ATP-binding cassette subfamily C (CFTR/MRP) protein 1